MPLLPFDDPGIHKFPSFKKPICVTDIIRVSLQSSIDSIFDSEYLQMLSFKNIYFANNKMNVEVQVFIFPILWMKICERGNLTIQSTSSILLPGRLSGLRRHHVQNRKHSDTGTFFRRTNRKKSGKSRFSRYSSNKILPTNSQCHSKPVIARIGVFSEFR